MQAKNYLGDLFALLSTDAQRADFDRLAEAYAQEDPVLACDEIADDIEGASPKLRHWARNMVLLCESDCMNEITW